MEKPKLKIKLEPIDQLIEIIAFIGLCLLILLPAIYFKELPNEIPTHFGPNGEADSYGRKGMIWILPIVGFFSYLMMYWINKYPHTFNYPQKITKENALNQYRIATKMIRTLNAITSCVFAYLTYSSIQIALGNQKGLGVYFMLLFLVILFGPIIYYLFKATKK